ncbi:hypothetical protein U1Q18_012419 [Sarracenia purpurea var. burkii]
MKGHSEGGGNKEKQHCRDLFWFSDEWFSSERSSDERFCSGRLGFRPWTVGFEASDLFGDVMGCGFRVCLQLVFRFVHNWSVEGSDLFATGLFGERVQIATGCRD